MTDETNNEIRRECLISIRVAAHMWMLGNFGLGGWPRGERHAEWRACYGAWRRNNDR